MSDVGTGVFDKGRVVPEDVALSVLTFACFGWFVLHGVVVSTFIECFLVRRCCLVKDALSVSGHLATRESRHQRTTSPPTNPPPSHQVVEVK